MSKKLMKGNEAIGEAAIRAGAEAYFCYPITPQTEIAEYLARRDELLVQLLNRHQRRTNPPLIPS